MADRIASSPRRRPVWRRLALPASLVLNLFLLAVIGGHQLQHDEVPAGPPLARALANAEATLGADDAAAFGSTMRAGAPRYLSAVHALDAARDALDQQVTAEPYDPVATQAALTVWHQRWDDFLDALSGTLVDAVGKVSPEGRRKLVDLRHRSQPHLSP